MRYRVPLRRPVSRTISAQLSGDQVDWDTNSWWKRLIVRFARPLAKRIHIQREEFEFKSFDYDPQTCLRDIKFQQREIEMLYHLKLTKLYCSPEFLNDLEDVLYQPLEFTSRMWVTVGGMTKILELEVMVVPWMEGYLLV